MNLTIKNISNGNTVSKGAKFAKSHTDSLLGMILSKNKDGLILKSSFGIHTFFMNQPIDILILDRDKKVVQIKESLAANRLYFWNPKYDLIVELPARTINSSKTKKGDKLDF